MPNERIFTPGEFIGDFKVERLIAGGGSALVYEATPDPVRRDDLLSLGITRVAIKVARLDVLGPDRVARRQLVDRFDREYRTLLSLMHPGHPNVVEVYERGQQEGLPFLVLEYLEGPSLGDVLASAPPLPQMLELFRKVCAAVAFLHERGICHRDLKPANILMRGDEPVIVDFGCCLPPSGPLITAPGSLVGTPGYISLEAGLHSLEREPVLPYLPAPTDDVWALGILLHESLTGGAPWRTPPRLFESLVAEMQQQAPLHASDVNPEVPRALGDAAQRLLEREVYARPQNGTAALALLEPVLRANPMTGHVPRPLQPAPMSPSPPVAPRPPPPARARPRRMVQGWRAHTAAVLVALGVGYGARIGVERAFRTSGHSPGPVAQTAPDPQRKAPETGSKDEAPGKPDAPALPLPEEPLPGQLRAPCPKPYVEASGGCWDVFQSFDQDGKRRPCPSTNPNNREMKDQHGQWRCYSAVIRPPKNAEQPVKGAP